VGRLLAARNIPAVVAMQAKVKNIVANTFATAFYKSLGEQKPIDRAVRAGREAIREGPDRVKLAFGVPVLYLLRGHGPLIPTLAEAKRSKEPGPESTSQSAAPSLNVEMCPTCKYTLTARERTLAVCPECGLRLRCKKCKHPYDRPDRQNFCGNCEAAVQRRADVAVKTAARAPQAAAAIGSVVRAPSASQSVPPPGPNAPPKPNLLAQLFPSGGGTEPSSGKPS
jgi:hypothetical protein